MIELAHRIVLTEKCNRKCPHCFNAEQRAAAKHMDTEKLFSFWVANQEFLQNAELKIMGGEPTCHPEFLSVIDLGLVLFDKISIFTNGTNLSHICHPDMLASHWSGKIDFIINAFTFELDERWAKWGKYFKKFQLHFVLGEEYAIHKAKLMAKSISPNQAHFIISGDTQINIFDPRYRDEYRVRYIESLIEIIPMLRDYGHSFSYDHVFPNCFWTQEMLDQLQSYNITPPHLMRRACCHTILGLLDTNFDLWYCNQTRIRIGNMFVNGKPRRMEEIHRMLRNMPCRKCDSLRPECQKCPAIVTCKSACWHDHNYQVHDNFYTKKGG